MLRLIKYEYRRNLPSIFVMLSGILLVQCFFLFSVIKEDASLVLVASMFLIFAAFLSVLGMLIFSVALYSRELNTKASYLTFMTPTAMPMILGAKLIAALILGAFFALVLGLLATWDISLLISHFPQLELAQRLLDQLAAMANTNLSSLLARILAIGITFLINFFTVVVIAYLAITLGATVLQNKRFKGAVSFLFFVALIVLLEWGVTKLPLSENHESLLREVLSVWPQYAAFLASIVVSFILSAWLLDKKVSL